MSFGQGFPENGLARSELTGVLKISRSWFGPWQTLLPLTELGLEERWDKAVLFKFGPWQTLLPLNELGLEARWDKAAIFKFGPKK